MPERWWKVLAAREDTADKIKKLAEEKRWHMCEYSGAKLKPENVK